MKTLFILFSFLCFSVQGQTITETFGSGTNTFSIDFVTIGKPVNMAEDTGFGSVAYVYNLGKFEISRDQIEKANSAGGLGLTLADMTIFGGNGANRPASGVSWNEAARFVNWLNTSQGFQAAYNFTTSGPNDNITLWGAGQYSGTNQFRHKDAYYFLPSMDEWYKAAYYDPNKPGGAGYWNFPNVSDRAPSAVSGGIAANTAVYDLQNGPADTTNAGGLSAFGTMAQGGNSWEWNESAFDGGNSSAIENRWLRGGSWSDGVALFLSSDGLNKNEPASNNSFYGFRVASVPEPSALSLILFGLGGLAMFRRRLTRSFLILFLASHCLGEKVHGQTLYEIINPNLSHQLVTIQSNTNVAYSYKISTTLTSLSDWLVFLNAKAKIADPSGLFKATDFSRTQSNGIYAYSLRNAGTGNNPVRNINLYDAYRYVNWIENGADENADTEVGSYNLTGLDISKRDLAQRVGTAKYFIQTRDEWFGAWYSGIINTPVSYREWTTSTNVYGFPIYMYAYAHYAGGLIGPGAGADVPGRSSVFGGEMSFRITSVPEPSSLSLLLAGGAVLMAGRRRK